MNPFRWIVVFGLSASCSMSTFDDKRAAAWSDSNGSVGIDSQEYGVAVAGVTTDTPGTTIAVLGTSPLGLGVVTYDATGGLQQFGANIDGFDRVILSSTPSLVGAPEVVRSVGALVAIGGLGSADEILFFDVGSGEPEPLGKASGADCGLPGANLGHRMVFRETGEEGVFDLIALRDDEIFIISDLDPTATTHSCTHCTLDAVGSDVVVGEFIDDSPLFDGEEVIVSMAGTISLFSAARLKETDGLVCSSITPQFSGIGSDGIGLGAATDYGARMAIGSSSEEDKLHIALTAPLTDEVYVLSNFDISTPNARPQSLVPSEDSGAFGDGPILFLDLDTNEGDELVVGDPLASPEGLFSAGQVNVYELSEEEVFEPRAVIYDSTPEDGQNYGRALAEAEFVFGEDDSDLLVVGAVNETFAIFQTLSNGVDPRQ